MIFVKRIPSFSIIEFSHRFLDARARCYTAAGAVFILRDFLLLACTTSHAPTTVRIHTPFTTAGSVDTVYDFLTIININHITNDLRGA